MLGNEGNEEKIKEGIICKRGFKFLEFKTIGNIKIQNFSSLTFWDIVSATRQRISRVWNKKKHNFLLLVTLP